MQIYLPIAEVSVDVLLILGLGAGVGFLSGLFGIGGGFLTTPFLIFMGIPPAVAVATEANQVAGSSVSGSLAHWRRGNVDIAMGLVLLAGGLMGSGVGVWLFGVLGRLGQLELVISLAYVLLLSAIGGIMLVESVRTTLRKRRPGGGRQRLRQHTMLHRLPMKMRFRKSRLYISALLPLGLGALVGVLAAIMGVGGGFLLVPAMIYILGMPTSVVVGTSLFQIVFVTANVAFLQAASHQTVDLLLAALLLVGGVIGAQFGSRAGTRLRGEELRGLLAVLILLVAGKMAYDLVATPAYLFTLQEGMMP